MLFCKGEKDGRDDRESIIIIIIIIIASRFKSFLEMGVCAFVGRGSMKYSYESAQSRVVTERRLRAYEPWYQITVGGGAANPKN